MKLLKKIAPFAISALMIGATAAAANISDWKGTFTSGSTAIVVGSGAIGTDDMTAATALAGEIGLDDSTPSITGEAVNLGSGDDQIYLQSDINTNIEIVTKDDLANVLADDSFEDDAGTTYDYEQTLTVGATPFTFDDSGNDLDDPAFILNVGTTTADPLYTWKVTFEDSVDFDDVDSEGEEITLFGKSYTVGTGTDGDYLQLLGSGQTLNLDSTTSSTTINFDNVGYTIQVVGVNTDGDEITIKVTKGGTSEQKTITEGTSKKINGLSLFAKDVNSFAGSAGTWAATIQAGADELWLPEAGGAVATGPDKTEIEGTDVTFTGTTDALDAVEIAIVADDNDVDHLAIGDSFTDPVFGSVKVVFSEVANGPTVGAAGDDSNADRLVVEFVKSADTTIGAKFSVKGNEATFDFSHTSNLEDDDGADIHVIEGESVAEDEYFFLMSGSSRHFVQATNINADDDAASDDDVTLEDVFSGATWSISDKDLDAATAVDWVIDGQTYKVYYGAGANEVIITSSDYGLDATLYAYPYVEPVAGDRDIKIALTDQVTTAAITDASTVIELPTGDFDTSLSSSIVFADATADAAEAITIGTVTYVISDAADDTVTIAIDEGGDSDDADDPDSEPGLLFIEAEDNSDSDDLNALYVPTEYATFAEIDAGTGDDDDANAFFTSPNNVMRESFDDTDFTGSIDSWGTFYIEDSSDDDQALAWFTYGDEQMYADISIAESSAVGGQTSWVPVRDSDLAAYSGMNVIAIGGTAVNKVARRILSLDENTVVYGTESAWQTPTQVTGTGRGILWMVTSPYNPGKMALLVAGYEGSDTLRTANFLTLKANTLAKSKAIIDTVNNVEVTA
jgi:hypothetical protein